MTDIKMDFTYKAGLTQKERIEQQIKELLAKMDNFELDPDDYEEEYEDTINEFNAVIINGIEYAPAYVLKNIDEPAYNEELNNYVDSLDKEDDPKYQELVEELEKLEDQLEELE